MDKRVLGERREEVFLVVEAIIVLESGDVSKEVEVGGGGRGDGGAGDNIVRGGGVCELWRSRGSEDGGLHCSGNEDGGVEGRIVKGGGWGAGDGDNGRGRLKSVGTWAWEVPSVIVAIEDLKDGSSGVGEVLLIYVVNSRPGRDRELGEGGGGDDGGLGRSERHFKQSALLWRLF